MLVSPNACFGLLRQGVERMLQLRHHVLQHRVSHVTNKEIVLGMPFGHERRVLVSYQGGLQIRGIGHHMSFFGVSPTVVNSSGRSEEHTSELQSLMRISYAVFCLK